MLKNMRKGKKARFVIFSIIGILLVIYIFWVVSLFTHTKKNTYVPAQVAPTNTIVLPTQELLITPTIIPSSKTNLKTFIFSDPNSRYSFEYPALWSVVEIGHDNIVRINFTGHCRVEFSTKVMSQSSANSQTKDITYARRTFKKITSTNNNVSMETYALLNATSKDGFSLVTVDLPPSNASYCQQTVGQILTSLTFGQ